MILTEKRAICAALAEPSSGLEPETPSLPWRIQAAKEGLRNSACWRVFPATTSLRRSGASFPRRALSLPQKPRTCPQYLSPDPRRTAPRPSIAPRRIRRNLARPRRSSRARSSHDCWQHREASAQMRQCSLWPARLRALRLGGRVAATVRSALDTESPPAHHRNCTTGVVS